MDNYNTKLENAEKIKPKKVRLFGKNIRKE